jgi:murein DD-endopeptidase
MNPAGRASLLACIAVLATACATSPGTRESTSNRVIAADQVAARAAATAASLVGAPYRYGGAGPDDFDCSGLVYYSYRLAGVTVPRVSRDQMRASRPLQLDEARVGDLVFFSVAGKVSHVGIYLGDHRFVHAPSTGRTVAIASLRQPYYQRHFLRAGRLDVLFAGAPDG